MAKNFGDDWYCVGTAEGHDEFFKKHKDCPSNKGCGENIHFATEVGQEGVILWDFTNIDDEGMRDTRVYLEGQEDRVPEHLKEFMKKKDAKR